MERRGKTYIARSLDELKSLLAAGVHARLNDHAKDEDNKGLKENVAYKENMEVLRNED